jgi:hypothetical protein
MKFARTQRITTALMLYSLVLLSTFACALGHGQSSGLWLSGVGELTCNVSESGSPQAPALPSTGSGFDCPLCSGGNLAPMAAQSWALNLPQWLPTTRHPVAQNPLPRRLAKWPTASPRAPPAHS